MYGGFSLSDLRSLKKYSWLVSGLVMLITGISALTVSDFSWLPVEYQKYVVMCIGVCGVFVKVFVENARVTRAEELVVREYNDYTDPVLNDEYTTDMNGDDKL